jgi:hypothetical protein
LPSLFAISPTSLNKFHAKKTVYGGITFDSKREADFARDLDFMKHARGRDRVESWERQVRFPLLVNGDRICTYVCDFLVHYADGRNELVEVKGYWTPEAKLKRKLFEALILRDHPEINYRIA